MHSTHPEKWLIGVASLLLTLTCSHKDSQDTKLPHLLDDRLSIELIDENPHLVTPIGLAIDAQDQLYILESHTHSPPSDYTGPRFDRIKKGIDEDGDGRPESWRIYADSIVAGMNLAFGPEQKLYLVQKDRVMAYLDTDGDGVSDESRQILRMYPPENVYDHAGMLGVAVSPDGWLYVTRGNTGGQAWRMEGSDGNALSGYGDGGNVIRCRLDGSNIEAVATGFWNPFGITLAQDGRILLSDNDPDSRGPNRLLDIVPGGDYGYQSLYGGSGIHPFLAWNGELPGTLPYAAALGEAPTGLLDAGSTQFPEDYRGNLLCAIWEENTIVRIPLQPRGSSVRGETSVLVQGDSSFHPVAFASNSKGELYLTDWVIRQYPNHGSGRLWRIKARSGKAATPLSASTSFDNPFFSLWEDLRSQEPLLQALKSGDPFLQTLARKRLGEPEYAQEALALAREKSDPTLRMQGLLSLFHSELQPPAADLKKLLADPNEGIRRMTLIYIGTHLRTDLLSAVANALHEGLITPALLETYLAALRHLQPDFVRGYRNQQEVVSKKLKRELPPGYLISLIQDASLPAELRAAALPYLAHPETHVEVLATLLETSEGPLQEGLLQIFRKIPHERAAAALLIIALDKQQENSLRTQAILSLGYQPGEFCDALTQVLKGVDDDALATTTIRYLCRCSEKEQVSTAIATYRETHPQSDAGAAWQLCTGEATGRPTSDAQWEAHATGGDPKKGKWVFQSLQAQCQRCHKVNGWGGDFGPDLSHVGSSKSPKQLITAILQPSLEISPEWQGWFVTTKEGETHYGRQIDVGFDEVELMNADGEFVSYPEPRDYGVAPASLMPEGLENAFTPSEFGHLVAYLVSLK